MRLRVVLELIGRSESGKIDPTFADSIVSLAISLMVMDMMRYCPGVTSGVHIGLVAFQPRRNAMGNFPP